MMTVGIDANENDGEKQQGERPFARRQLIQADDELHEGDLETATSIR